MHRVDGLHDIDNSAQSHTEATDVDRFLEAATDLRDLSADGAIGKALLAYAPDVAEAAIAAGLTRWGSARSCRR